MPTSIRTRRPRLRPRRTALAACLVAALGAVGCGGGSSSSSSSHSTAAAAAVTITKGDFIAKANAICAKADPALSEANARLATLRDRNLVAAVVDGTYVPAIEAQIAQIRALGAPAGEQAPVAAMLALVEGDLARLKRHPALVTTDVFSNFAKVAHPYGLAACAPLS
jgi:hypothetical protein